MAEMGVDLNRCGMALKGIASNGNSMALIGNAKEWTCTEEHGHGVDLHGSALAWNSNDLTSNGIEWTRID